MPQVFISGQISKSFASVRLEIQKSVKCRISNVVFSLFARDSHSKLCLGQTKVEPLVKIRHTFWSSRIRVAEEYQEGLSDEDEDLCPVECVREFTCDEEFSKILEKAKERGSLVVVDFFRTSCGSCKYIEQGFAKLCKKSGNHEAPVIFLKHNVSICFLLVTDKYLCSYLLYNSFFRLIPTYMAKIFRLLINQKLLMFDF